ncbi:MAG: hypothetical protein ACOCPM_07180 [Bacteroidales bacterium]
MKGIMFKPEMFQAVIEERKTQTRRLGGLDYINQNPDRNKFLGLQKDPEVYKPGASELNNELRQTKGMYTEFYIGDSEYYRQLFRPRYQPGEVVYLKEPYLLDAAGNVIYKHKSDVQMQNIARWKNKMFMPARYARYFIEIVTARPERLQDITEYDAHWEGVRYSQSPMGKCYYDYRYGGYNILTGAIDSYRYLWQTIHGEESWNKNPWVWVYQFKLSKANNLKEANNGK